MRKKILFIHECLRGGGAEKVLVDILNNFDFQKYEVSLILLDSEGVYNDKITSNVTISYLTSPKELIMLGYLQKYKLWFLADSFLKRRLLKVIGDTKFDTCISFMEGISTRCHNLILTNIKKNISWVHTDLSLNNWCLSSFRSLAEQSSIYLKMDQIVVVSDGANESFKKIFPNANSQVIYNLIDERQIREKAKAKLFVKRRFTVCSVGRLIDLKRQDRIIDVADLCKTRGLDIDFIILGQGPLFDTLKSSIKKRNLEDNVHLLGFQSNPYAFINSSDVFLLTSDSEGYPLVVCESLCLGKPIISTDVTGPHELLRGGYGILTTKDTKDIFAAIKSLYDDNDKLLYYSGMSIEKSKIFDIQKQMFDIYQIL